tara:strand:- start:567 stop:788 length:222 start_codon:yes stop_codon:yes gene_type:complete
MIQIYGDKLSNVHSFGQKKNSVASKVKKVAITSAKVLGGTVGVLGAIGAVAGFDKPMVEQKRQRGAIERTLRR